MELYGNINNLSKSIFEFDKIYSSYTDAIANQDNDGVLINRYALINYSKGDEGRLYNLAKDNHYTPLNTAPTYQQIIDFVRKDSNAVLQDYDHSILLKTQDGYQIVMNFKLTLANQEREASENFRENSIDIYADYMKVMSQFFGYNGISLGEIDRIWTNNFNWKDAVVTYSGHDTENPIIVYPLDLSDITFSTTTAMGDYYPTYQVTLQSGNKFPIENFDSMDIKKYYIYLYYRNEDFGERGYRGECTGLTISSDSTGYTLNFKILLVDPTNEEKFDTSNLSRISLVRRPEHEINIDSIGAQEIQDLWYEGKLNGTPSVEDTEEGGTEDDNS